MQLFELNNKIAQWSYGKQTSARIDFRFTVNGTQYDGHFAVQGKAAKIDFMSQELFQNTSPTPQDAYEVFNTAAAILEDGVERFGFETITLQPQGNRHDKLYRRWAMQVFLKKHPDWEIEPSRRSVLILRKKTDAPV